MEHVEKLERPVPLVLLANQVLLVNQVLLANKVCKVLPVCRVPKAFKVLEGLAVPPEPKGSQVHKVNPVSKVFPADDICAMRTSIIEGATADKACKDSAPTNA